MTTKCIAILDEFWRVAVKLKVKYVCEHCQIQGVRMEAAHVCGRRHRATRWGAYIGKSDTWDLCGHCLCHNCHQQYDEHGPREQKIVERTIGVMRKVLIQEMAHSLVAKNQDFDIIKNVLEGLIESYNQESTVSQKLQPIVTQSNETT